MSLLQQAPRFDAAAAARLARDLYGIEAAATPLPGERDQNFLLTAGAGGAGGRGGDGERFVLKVANAAEERAVLEAQTALMEHVAGLDLCPRVVPTVAGDLMGDGPDGHFVRLLTWVDGTPLGALEHPPDGVFEDLGARLGQLDRALADFDHPALHRAFHWDLAHAFQVIGEHSTLIADDWLRGLVERTAGYVDARDGRTLGRLRRSIVHGDPNDHNVLIAPGGQTGDISRSDRGWINAPIVTRLIDFGDAVHSYTVADPAIAAAYAVLDKRDPMRVAAAIVRTYHAAHPLTDDELAAFFGLVQLRLCVSVCLAAYQQPDRPSDPYVGISQAPIRRTLPALAAIHPDAAEQQLREACGLGRHSTHARFGSAATPLPRTETLARRRQHIGSNLSVGYRDPLKLAHGWMQYLVDDQGRQYLDAYNNVPHVGHSHPGVVSAAAAQLRALNTNTRYLHDSLPQLAERVCATLPDPLRVCYFVNSGSEANELALRLARAHTRRRNLIVQDAAYHGNTTTLIEISPYKFNGPGGQGRPEWVHVVPMPDDYRGPYKRGDPAAGDKYAHAVEQTIDGLRQQDIRIGAFIAESYPSVGGQIVPPRGYLPGVYRAIREEGGVCIADEVQTAYGRIGTHFYAFEAQGVVPDIVVLGKPVGNGHPLGAVVTTPAIAASFDNGMEFFSTFGGSTVSCAVGLAVLDAVHGERLQAHALRVGQRLAAALQSVAARHEVVGDVRGSGLFFGVELVERRQTLEPATAAAALVVNSMRDNGVLIGTDGPFHNVLKIRPPMPFAEHDIDRLASCLDAALGALN